MKTFFIEIKFELLWNFFFTRFFLNFQSWVGNEIKYGVLLECKFQIISFPPNCGILKRQMPLLNYSCYVKVLWLGPNNSLQFSTFFRLNELTVNILRAQTKLVETLKQDPNEKWSRIILQWLFTQIKICQDPPSCGQDDLWFTKTSQHLKLVRWILKY